MTADVSSAAAGDTTNPKALATIPEDHKHADTADAKEMDANDEETTENSSNHSKSHILVTTVNSTGISNAIEEMRAERLAMATEDKAIRDKQTEQMMDMLKNTQQMLTNYFQFPPSFNPIPPPHQLEHQRNPMTPHHTHYHS